MKTTTVQQQLKPKLTKILTAKKKKKKKSNPTLEITLALSVGLETILRTFKTGRCTKKGVPAFVKKKYSSIINFGGKVKVQKILTYDSATGKFI